MFSGRGILLLAAAVSYRQPLIAPFVFQLCVCVLLTQVNVSGPVSFHYGRRYRASNPNDKKPPPLPYQRRQLKIHGAS